MVNWDNKLRANRDGWCWWWWLMGDVHHVKKEWMNEWTNQGLNEQQQNGK